MKPEPTSREDLTAWLRLTLVPHLQPRHHRALLRHFACPHGVLAASRASVVQLCGSEVADALAAGAARESVEAALRWLEADGHHLVALGDPCYPKALLHIDEPPTVFYARGRVELLDKPSFAIVGSRNATVQGQRDAEAFASDLGAAGLCIVSGLAAGIDAAAHRGGLAQPGSSVAVMGTGADRIYPARNRKLAEQLALEGCVISEFPLGMPPLPGNFPQRNRLISGLSLGVLVIEAAIQSGSLITARRAAHQGRDVFAMPGSIHSPLAKGCHDLIKEGARLVESAQDILVELGLAQAPAKAATANVGPSDPLLDAMGYAPVTLDQIASCTGLGAASLSAAISRLEIDGRVAALAGGLFQRIEGAT